MRNFSKNCDSSETTRKKDRRVLKVTALFSSRSEAAPTFSSHFASSLRAIDRVIRRSRPQFRSVTNLRARVTDWEPSGATKRNEREEASRKTWPVSERAKHTGPKTANTMRQIPHEKLVKMVIGSWWKDWHFEEGAIFRDLLFCISCEQSGAMFC